MTAAAIHIESVSKTYVSTRGAAVAALSETNLRIGSHEFFSLVGPSGCGKSTLMNVVAGLLPPSAGQVTIGSRRVTGPDPSVGIVFQKPTLLAWLTIEANVLLPSKISGQMAGAKERAGHLLRLAGLEGVKNRYPDELSGGMQQRAGIVRALVSDPQVLLMDEPFSALDEFTRETLNDALLELWMDSPKTVIFITHNIAEAVYLSDRVGVMTSGPGRLGRVVDIDLARPRVDTLRATDDFNRYVGHIRGLIDHTPATTVGEVIA